MAGLPFAGTHDMNFKIEKIREAELQIDKLVGQEKKMRRAFMADGTVDAKEQKQLDEVEGKIAKLKGAVAKIRAEIEAASRAWEARSTDYARAQSEMGELATWGHAEHPKVQAEADKIAPLTTDQMWTEAVTQLDATLKVLNPAVEDYRKQVAAKAAYDPLRADTDTRLSRAAAADPQTPDIEAKVTGLTAQVDVIDKSLVTKDYVSALETVKGMEADLTTLEVLVKDARDQKADYDKEMAELAPRLKEAQGCVFDTLADKNAELGTDEAAIAEAAARHDYVVARSGIAALAVKVDLYMAEYAAVVDAQTLYESRLPRIDAEITGVQQCKYPDLTAQQTAILDIDTQMRGMAGAGSFEQAIEEMNKLDPLIETYKQDEENARLGEEYAAKKAAIAPRMEKVNVCNFPPLEEAQLKVTGDHDAAEKAAQAKKYADGIALLGDVEVALGDFETKLAAQETAQTDYENGLGQITPRYEAVASSKYPQLAAQDMQVSALHDSMAAAATGRDYVAAFAAMSDLEREIGVVETTLEALEAKQAEYEMRVPPLVQRFDGSMISDYAQLEDERDKLLTARSDMEAAAANRDFPLALDHLNAVERMLNDLDAQAGNLDAQKKQYEAMLAQIEPGLKVVEDCKHTELTPKKTPIMDIRADMLSLAVEEDFGVALERANSLIPLLAEFAKLEAQLEEYLRRLEVIKPRLETVKAFTYKSLKERQDKITALFGEMTAQAAKAELTDALAKMGELETLVGDIIKANDELKLQEAVYKKLHGDLKAKMAVVEGSKIDKEEVKTAAEAAKEAWKKLEDLGAKDEYVLAIPQADDVTSKIEAFQAAVDKYGDAKEAFEMLRDMANAGYGEAKTQAKDYEDLEDAFDKLTDLRDEMTKAGEGASPDYDDAKAKAQKLLDAIKDFHGKWVEMTNREAAVKASADAAFARFGALPEDAAEKAQDDYDVAKLRKEQLEKALSKRDLESAEKLVGELNEALDALEGALKTKEEHKADYEGRLATLQPRVDKATSSPFAKGLKTELEAVTKALAAMTDRAAAEDYEGGVKAAPAVETALSAFDSAEDVLEQIKAQLDERMPGIGKDIAKLGEISLTFPQLMPRIIKAQGDYSNVQALIGNQDYKAADAPSATLRDELRALLDDAEKLEDAAVQAEKDKGILDKAEDLLDTVVDKAKEKLKEEALDYIDGKVKGAKSLVEGAEELLDGEIIDGVKDIVKGVDDLSPIPVSKTIRRGAKVAEEVYDFIKDRI